LDIEWPQSTNKGTALLKLVHQFDPRRILIDEYVGWFFDQHIIETAAQMLPDEAPVSKEENREFSRIAYHYSILREIYIDEWISSSIRSGCRQLLLLGAGYDTRFLRLPVIKECSVDTYEVDLPQTITDKIATLRRHLDPLPHGLHFIPLDFNRDSLAAVIERGFNPSVPTSYVWQGVSYYLPQKTVIEVLDFIRLHMSQRSTLAFDCCSRFMTYVNDKVPGIKVQIERLKQINEPYLFGMESTELKHLLGAKGFKDILIQTQAELEQLIMKVRTLPENMWYVVTAKA
jgi:methyltransferase (TIGR00027 family)